MAKAIALIFVLGGGFLTGCSGARVIGEERYVLRGQTEVATRLKLDGYYYYAERGYGPASDDYFVGEAIYTILLWKDGTVAYLGPGGFTVEDPEYGPVQYGTLEEAHEDFQRFIENPERLDPEGDDWGGADWGAFRVEGDSLRVQVLRPRLGTYPCCTYDVVEYDGRVVSDTSFVLRGRTYYFHPLEEKPDSTNWTQTHPDLQ